MRLFAPISLFVGTTFNPPPSIHLPISIWPETIAMISHLRSLRVQVISNPSSLEYFPLRWHLPHSRTIFGLTLADRDPLASEVFISTHHTNSFYSFSSFPLPNAVHSPTLTRSFSDRDKMCKHTEAPPPISSLSHREIAIYWFIDIKFKPIFDPNLRPLPGLQTCFV